jgi:hypothetical protein
LQSKKQVEVFVAGCPLCDIAVKTVREVTGTSCDLVVHDLRPQYATREAIELAMTYGVHRVPAVVVDGNLCDCCKIGPVDAHVIRDAVSSNG